MRPGYGRPAFRSDSQAPDGPRGGPGGAGHSGATVPESHRLHHTGDRIMRFKPPHCQWPRNGQITHLPHRGPIGGPITCRRTRRSRKLPSRSRDRPLAAGTAAAPRPGGRAGTATGPARIGPACGVAPQTRISVLIACREHKRGYTDYVSSGLDQPFSNNRSRRHCADRGSTRGLWLDRGHRGRLGTAGSHRHARRDLAARLGPRHVASGAARADDNRRAGSTQLPGPGGRSRRAPRAHVRQPAGGRPGTHEPACPRQPARGTAARNAGVTPLHRGDPGYASRLDRDGDGIACE